MLIDPVPLISQINGNEMDGSFLHNFYILSRTGNKALYLYKAYSCCHGNRSLNLILSKSNF